MLDSSEEDNRQWIQRRGRTLRKGGSETAIIHDFAPEFNLKFEWNVDWWRRNIDRLEELLRDCRKTNEKVKTAQTLTEIYRQLGDYYS